MRKLTLDVHALLVESFDTRAEDEGRGTVRGLESYPNQCHPPSGSLEPEIDTCAYATCAGVTCYYSCNGTCNCGTVGCPQLSEGYTNCVKDASCVEQCHPTGPGC